ncbi:MAG: polyprenyl synthetase family protein [Chloroflexi bacterium]|nr:polyprenyl synthetase family protein [Chloroflexota bacterium]
MKKGGSLQLPAIYQPVAEGLVQVEDSLRGLAKGDFPMLVEVLGHILNRRGKRIRPALTLLAGQFYGNTPPELVAMATAVELLHTATLIHDDVVDGAGMRRGSPTVNYLWREGTAVLAGDYLFAKSAELVASTGDQKVINLFAQVLMTICQGELRQLFAAYDLNQDREQYYQRIARKTASLFATATQSGAILSGAPPAAVVSLREYGFNLGMAFQIVDDILDFRGEAEEMGKPVGSDLLQGSLTLPVLLWMEKTSQTDLLQDAFGKRDRASFHQVVEAVRTSTALEEAFQIAGQFSSLALDSLASLPNHPCRHSLERVAEYALRRRH